MKNIIITLCLLLNSFHVYSQNSKKEANTYYRELHKIDTNEVKSGQHLEMAELFTVESFISYYLEHGKICDSKKWGIETIRELYSDSTYIYFGTMYFYGLLKFVKVAILDLGSIDLSKLDGDTIREQFTQQIIPQTDKAKFNRRESMCMSIVERSQFTYNYQKEENSIFVSYRWKTSCELLFNIVNKKYIAKLSLNTYSFEKQ